MAEDTMVREAAKVQGQHVDYQLHTIGWASFEDLCFTIAKEKFKGMIAEKLPYNRDLGQDFILKKISEAGTEEEVIVCQCKHSIKPNQTLYPSMLDDDVEKIKKLRKRKEFNSYLLFTNMAVDGDKRIDVENLFKENCGVNTTVIGKETIVSYIQENKRLRMIVPRLYGLGDISTILDERAYDQAHYILTSKLGDLKTFVSTEQYFQSLEILERKGIVFLIGEPMVGKTTIAKQLCLSMIDQEDFNCVKIDGDQNIRERWDIHEKQLFFLDDVFGVIQFEYSKINDHNTLVENLMNIKHSCSKVVMTSRGYIFNLAKEKLKKEYREFLSEASITIGVQDLSLMDKRMLLYNHIKYGNQSKEFKEDIKYLLEEVAGKYDIYPGLANRLGSSKYISNVPVVKMKLWEFFEKPTEYLADIVMNLDDEEKTALVLIFAHGGKLDCPVSFTDEDGFIISKLHSTPSEVKRYFQALDGDFITLNDGKEKHWSFSHPTLMEAIGSLLFEDPEKFDVYVKYADLNTVLRSVACEGSVRHENRQILPGKLYDSLINRMVYVDSQHRTVVNFVAFQSDDEFLRKFMNYHHDFLNRFCRFSQLLENHPFITIIERCRNLELLNDDDIDCIYNYVTQCTLDVPDLHIFYDPYLQNFIGKDRLSELEEKLIIALIEKSDEYISNAPQTGLYIEYLNNLHVIYTQIQELYPDNTELVKVAKNTLEKIMILYEEEFGDADAEYELVFSDEMNDMIYRTGVYVYNEGVPPVRSVFDDLDH